jgi:hypothetical protein
LNNIYQILRPTAIAIAVMAICFAAFLSVSYIVKVDFVEADKTISYTDVVVLLLTTVTVIFAVAATALTLVGVWGFKNLIEDASKYAAKAADVEIGRTIQRAFESDGIFAEGMANEVREGNGPFAEWLRAEVQRQVREQMAFTRLEVPIDENDPSDEGDQD